MSTRARARRRSRRPAWQKALGGVLFAALVLWVVEMGLRLGGLEAAYDPQAIAGWRVSAGLSGAPVKGPRDGHEFRVSTNAEGLRTALPTARTPGTRRVALLGDSTVFGWGVDDGGTVADGLQQALAADHPEVGPVEVLNAGQPGYSSTQATWLYGEVVAAWQPDLTVLFVPLHDGNLVLVSDREHLRGADGLGARTRVALARHSRLYQLLRTAVFRSAGTASLVPDRADDEPRVPRVSDAERAQAVAELVQATEAWGGDVALGLLPFLADLTTRAPHPRPTSEWVHRHSATTGLPVVDVRGCCGPDGGHLVLPDDPGHLTAAGNHLVGAAMAPVVAGLLAD